MGNRWWLVVLMGMLVLVTACSTGGDGGNDAAGATSAGNVPEDQWRAFAKCMREHDIDFGLPGDPPETNPEPRDPVKYENARQACMHLLPNGGEVEPISAEELDKLHQDAKCLREHGFKVMDPKPDGTGMDVELGPGMTEEAAREAAKECGVSPAAIGLL